MEDYLIPCISKTLFGVECLGCGAQRALLLIFQGRFIDAFKMFPAIYTAILFFIIAGVYFISKNKNQLSLLKFFGILNLVIMIISFTCRHI
ncbi:DUF2752 domain-containing protein [Flavobacterium sp. H122]|uniref:DUF2752 domain-containing protein n=1 Tax=Flavobacterium sp. H122 TaxID=2529860 RepID=UPI0010AA68C4|nr:DUF2752 domain-containing protein [Flavobacterium sp. H122]